MLDHVQAAFLFHGSGPAAGAFVLAFGYRPSARPAADAGIILVMEGIIGNIMLRDEGPDVLFGPTEQRIDFHQRELGIPLDNAGSSTVGGLVAANGANPSIEALDRPAQRQHFTVMTALVRTNGIERAAVLLLVFRDRHLGADVFHFDAVALLDPLAKVERLLKLVASIQIKNADVRLDVGEHM